MIIIHKKRIKIIISCILIAVFAFSFQIASNQTKNENIIPKKQEQNIMETTATPVSGKTIVIDAGHRSARRTERKVAMELQKHKPT